MTALVFGALTTSDWLFWLNCELCYRTTDLETLVDDLELTINKRTQELEALHKENNVLISLLEDTENQSWQSNLQIRGISEAIDYLTFYHHIILGTILIDRLEIGRIQQALTRHQPDGPHNSQALFLSHKGITAGSCPFKGHTPIPR